MPPIRRPLERGDDRLSHQHALRDRVRRNDVTETRPYATATEAELDGLAEDYDAILAVMAARPGRCIMAPLTYREYANPATSSAMLIDGAAGSEPYNEEILIPKIAAALPATINSDGRPVLDFYNWTRNTSKTLMSTDGVHLTTMGDAALREFLFDRLAYLLTGAAMPDPVPHLPAHEIDESLAAIVIKFGSQPTTAGVNWGQDTFLLHTTNVLALNRRDGTSSGVSLEIFPSTTDAGTSGVWRNIGGGRSVALATYTGSTLVCTEFTTSSFFAGPGHTMTYRFTGLTPNASYQITATGSRNAAGPRNTLLTDGSAAQIAYDATLDPPVQDTDTFVADGTGRSTCCSRTRRGTNTATLGP